MEKSLPTFLKEKQLPELTIEEWSFVKAMNPHLKKIDLVKLIHSLSHDFYKSLSPFDEKEKRFGRENPIKALYNLHLTKISEGNIKFN